MVGIGFYVYTLPVVSMYFQCPGAEVALVDDSVWCSIADSVCSFSSKLMIKCNIHLLGLRDRHRYQQSRYEGI